MHEVWKKKHTVLVNRKEIILQHDNSRIRVAKVTLKKLKELKWKTKHSLDMASLDYHLWLSLGEEKRFLGNITNSTEFLSPTVELYLREIGKLVNHWQQVLNNDEECIED